MKVIIHKEFDVTCCGDCPYATPELTFDSYDEDHYKCAAHPDLRYIKHFVLLKSDLKEIPQWCPFKNGGFTEVFPPW